jgi:hypothetical protein
MARTASVSAGPAGRISTLNRRARHLPLGGKLVEAEDSLTTRAQQSGRLPLFPEHAPVDREQGRLLLVVEPGVGADHPLHRARALPRVAERLAGGLL